MPTLKRVPRKSKAEVERLKENWCKDPCYDLEDAEGFEAHKIELKIYRLEMELHWGKAHYIQLRRAASDYLAAFNNLKDILKK